MHPQQRENRLRTVTARLEDVRQQIDAAIRHRQKTAAWFLDLPAPSSDDRAALVAAYEAQQRLERLEEALLETLCELDDRENQR